MWTLLGFGTFLAVLWGSQAFRASVAPDTTRKSIFLLLALASFAWMCWGALRPVLIADAYGVLVRNPLSTRRLTWGEITGFRIGRHKLFQATCLIDLKDGASAYAFAIQVPKVARRRSDTRESRMVDELNARLVRSANAAATAD